MSSIKLAQNQVILFQGDSITDCERKKGEQDKPNNPEALGNGYARRIADGLLADHSSLGLRIFNRGISGHRVVDLYARWKSDAVNLKPDLISILVGVNDTWHEFNSGNGVELDRFEQVYRMKLQYTRERLPDVSFVLCEPFVLPCGAVTPEWEADIRGRQKIVADLAIEFDAVLVPFQKMFNEALKEAPPEYWAADGVHPTPVGHERMAAFWRACTGL
jgi:lysophospholipase L1-like esterase